MLKRLRCPNPNASIGARGTDRLRRSGNAILYGSPEISGDECASIESRGLIAGTIYRAGEAGAQATAQSERIRLWLVANRFQAISQPSMTSAKLVKTELASQWLRR
jgi:hypothetical protein